jgi:hypothetical protein
VNAGPQTLLNRPDGALYFADVAIGGHNVHGNRQHVITHACEFVVCVDVTDCKTTGVVKFGDAGEFFVDGVMGAIWGGLGGTETNVPGDGVKERESLHKKNRRIK